MSIIYIDFWKGLTKLHIIEKIIKVNNIELKNDILVYSKFGINHLNKKYKNFIKIFYTAESKLTDNDADYVIGSLPTNNNHIQLTNYERIEKNKYGLDFKLYQTLNSTWKLKEKTKFCCFIVSNSTGDVRNKIFNLLNQYKKVDSLGKYKNNCDILNNIIISTDKYYDIISQYKFIICCENTSKPYYLTEKIYNAFKSGTIPIYWGDPCVTDIFNEKTFINVENNPNYTKIVELIKLLDNNDDLYNEYFKNNPIINPELHDKRLNNDIKKICNILNSKKVI